MSFLLRRIIYTAIIIFMYNLPFFASLALLSTSLGFLMYVIIESQWEDNLVNQQHLVNEFALYLCLVLLFLLSGAVIPDATGRYIGWTLIGIVVALCVYNVIIIVIVSCKFLKLFILRLRVNLVTMSRRKASRKVSPVPSLPLV